MQATERFGMGTDPDGDGVVNELTRADITATAAYQATLPAPIRVLPREPALRQAVNDGQRLFQQIGCASCHIPALPLDKKGWIYTEPSPYKPPGNLQLGQTQSVSIDLASAELPEPRLRPVNGVVMVPLYRTSNCTISAAASKARTANRWISMPLSAPPRFSMETADF